VKSVLGVIGYGPEKSNYVFNRKYDQLSGNLTRVCSGEYRLEYFEIRCLDFEQHWNLDDATKTRLFYRRIDDFVKLLHEKCTANHVKLMILSDHGQEQVKGDIDIKKELNRLGLASNEYQYYLQATKARFWFHTDRARHGITDMLSSLRHGTVLTYQELHQYNVRFDNTDYGDVYFFPDAGFIIFPHDLYQPVANLFLGLVNEEQRSRIFNGRQKGEHGYLPYNESEYGFMMVLDQSCQASDEDVEIIDIAPSVLGLLGYDNAPTMKGRSAFVAV
jgi:predicted AlkP superfamily phosphohydrolase/phosphomutase